MVDQNGARIIPFPRRSTAYRGHFGPLAILDCWRITEAGPGPYFIEGVLDGRAIREVVLALNVSDGGLAMLRDRWVALGTPGSGGLAIVDDDAVLARTATCLSGDSP